MIQQAVGLDLGRHRAYLTVATAGGGVDVVRLHRRHEGRLLRLTGGAPRRPLDLLGVLPAPAVRELGRALVDSVLGPVRGPAAGDWSGPVALATPAGWSGERRQWLVDAARDAGLDAASHRVVARSEAVLAAWLATNPGAGGTVVAIDVDGGGCSVSVARPGPGGFVVTSDAGLRLRADAEAAAGVRAVVRRLAQVADALAHPPHRMVRHDDWASLASRVHAVVTAGTGAHHPGLLALAQGLFPASDVGPIDGVEPELAVAAGLARLDTLGALRPVEPRFHLRAVMRDGNRTWLRLVVPAAAAGWDDGDRPLGLGTSRTVVLAHPGGSRALTAEVGAVTPCGRPVPLAAGGRRFAHLEVLVRPDTRAAVELLVDGRVLLHNGTGPPVVVALRWPGLGRPVERLDVEAVDRRVLPVGGELSGSGPEPLDHVEPQLGGQAQRLDVDPLVVAVEPPEELAGPH
jgi:hypothetical protein